jgi:hypothetical protein
VLALKDPQFAGLYANYVRASITGSGNDAYIVKAIGHEQPGDITFKSLPWALKQPPMI